MGLEGIVIVVFILLAIAAVVWGLFAKKRSLAVALIALAVAGLAALGSYYSFAETHSMPWTLGYAAAALLALVVAARQLIFKKAGFC